MIRLSNCHLFLVLFSSFSLQAQSPGRVLHVPPAGAVAGQPVELEVILDSPGQVMEARLYHRVEGQSGYQEQDMVYIRSAWLGIVPGHLVSEEGLEYAFVFYLSNGSSLGFPEEDPLSSPMFVNVAPAPAKPLPTRSPVQQSGPRLVSQALVLSPGEGEVVPQNDVLLAVSFFNVDGVDPSRVRFYIDDQDVTDNAEVSADIATYVAPELGVGLHTARVEMVNMYDYELEPTIWTFAVGGKGSQIAVAAAEFAYSGKMRSDFSLNQVSGTTLSVGETATTLEGGWEWFKVKADIKRSTQESSFTQPKNRLSLTVRSSDFITIRMGDFTPVLSPYLVEGKRVRGMGTDINLKWLRLQTVSGELEQPIQGYLTEDRSYKITDITTDSTGLPLYILDRRGYTFARQYMAGRLGINLFNRVHFGVFGQKAKDEKGSVLPQLNSANFEVGDWQNSISVAGIDSGVYTFSNFVTALEGIGSYELAKNNWGGEKPMDNIVGGFDFGFSFDDRRLVFESAWAVSMLNRNIWDGAMSIADLDTTLDDSLDGYIISVYEDSIRTGGISTEGLPDPISYEDIFVANIYMTPLVPIDYQALEESPMAALMNMPSSAYNMKIRGFYYGNTMEMKYSQVGPEFSSLANPYLPSNLREFIFSDRFRVFDNKLSLGFEYKSRNNKILRTVVDPYKQKTSTTTMAFSPGAGMASFSGSFQTVYRTNEKTTLDTLIFTSYTGKDSISFKDNREDTKTSNRFISVNVPMNRNGRSLNFLLTYNAIGVEDQLEVERTSDYAQKAANSEAISFVTSTKFTSPLQTTLTFSRYKVQIPLPSSVNVSENESRLTTVGGNASYGLWGGKAKLSGGISLLNATGISQFTFIGLNGGGELKPFGSLVFRTSVSTKIKSTDQGTEVGTLAVKLSANYLF